MQKVRARPERVFIWSSPCGAFFVKTPLLHEHGKTLRKAGATFVIPDAIEAGLQLAGRVLQEFGYAKETVRDLIGSERDEEYRKADQA